MSHKSSAIHKLVLTDLPCAATIMHSPIIKTLKNSDRMTRAIAGDHKKNCESQQLLPSLRSTGKETYRQIINQKSLSQVNFMAMNNNDQNVRVHSLSSSNEDKSVTDKASDYRMFSQKSERQKQILEQKKLMSTMKVPTFEPDLLAPHMPPLDSLQQHRFQTEVTINSARSRSSGKLLNERESPDIGSKDLHSSIFKKHTSRQLYTQQERGHKFHALTTAKKNLSSQLLHEDVEQQKLLGSSRVKPLRKVQSSPRRSLFTLDKNQ